MRYRNVLLLILTSIAFAGCSDAEPAPLGEDTYMLANMGGMTFISGDQLTTELLRKADTFCQLKGKEFMPINVHSVDSGMYKFGNSSLKFRCLDKSDPQLHRPNFENSPNLIIEQRNR